MTYKVFISQPMSGRTNQAILDERAQIVDMLKGIEEGLKHQGVKVEVIESFNGEAFKRGARPLACLGDCIKLLGEADVVVFAKNWENSKGCKIEHQCAKEYGLSIVYMK